jgi:hypothetical protein
MEEALIPFMVDVPVLHRVRHIGRLHRPDRLGQRAPPLQRGRIIDVLVLHRMRHIEPTSWENERRHFYKEVA